MPESIFPAWKATQYDYDDISLLDESAFYRICLNSQQIAILKASLEPTHWMTRWSNYPGTKIELDQWITEIDHQLNTGELCMGCNDCYVDINNTINLYLENMTIVNTWVDAFEASGGVSVSSQVSNDIKFGQGHDTETAAQLCLAIELFINAFCDAALAAKNAEASGALEKAGQILVASAAAFAAGAFLLPPALAGAAAAAALGAAIGAVLNRILPGVIDDLVVSSLEDETARREMMCCMYSLLTAPASIIGWTTWKGNLFRSLSVYNCLDAELSANGQKLREFLRSTIAPSKELYVSFYNNLSDLGWLAYADSLPICAVCGDWCYLYDFTASNHSWQIDTAHDFGFYTASEGWKSEFPQYPESSPTENTGLFVYRDLPQECLMTKATCTFIYEGTPSGINRNAELRLYDGSGFLIGYRAKTNLDIDIGVQETLTIEAEEGIYVSRVYCDFVGECETATLTVTLLSVQIEGLGPNPEGLDNC